MSKQIKDYWINPKNKEENITELEEIIKSLSNNCNVRISIEILECGFINIKKDWSN